MLNPFLLQEEKHKKQKKRNTYNAKSCIHTVEDLMQKKNKQINKLKEDIARLKLQCINEHVHVLHILNKNATGHNRKYEQVLNSI